MSKKERKELNRITEEIFLRSNQTESYEKAIELFHTYYISADDMVNKISDGEIVDKVSLKNVMQHMIYSYRNAEKMRIATVGSHIVNPGNIHIPNDNIEASIKGNEHMGKFALEKDVDDFERGMWLLRMAQSY